MSFEITFPGGVAVEATYRGHSVRTDQPVGAGGRDSAMAPFDLFFASIGTCMGFYALRFCQQRSIPTQGLGLSVTPVRTEDGKSVATVKIELRLPYDFPDKYREAIVRAVDHCAVKRAIVEPPKFEMDVTTSSPSLA